MALVNKKGCVDNVIIWLFYSEIACNNQFDYAAKGFLNLTEF
jgi:hypothetical protein